MRLAFACIQDASDLSEWSGIPYYLQTHLSKVVDLRLISPLQHKRSLWLNAKTRFYNRGKHGRFFPHYHPHALRKFGQQIERRIDDADALFSIFPDPAVAARVSVPWFFFSDATFASLQRTYPSLNTLAIETQRAGHRFWQDSLNKAAGAFFSSEWAADSAIEDYGADPSRVHVVPMGANLTPGITRDTFEAGMKKRTRNACRLLWMGVDWERKSGALAVAVMQALQKLGIPASLQVVGVNEETIGPQPAGVTISGFFDKSTSNGKREWEESFQSSHFFIMPSQAEAFGLVFGEASAFGLPSIATRAGGIPTAVRDGINGFTFPADTFVEMAVQEISRLWQDQAAYDALCQSSFERYQTELNWDAFSALLIETIKSVTRSSA